METEEIIIVGNATVIETCEAKLLGLNIDLDLRFQKRTESTCIKAGKVKCCCQIVQILTFQQTFL